jgi:hypothetical protein
MAALLRQHRPDLLIEVLDRTAESLNQLECLVGGAYSLFNLADAGPVPMSRFQARSFRDYALVPLP